MWAPGRGSRRRWRKSHVTSHDHDHGTSRPHGVRGCQRTALCASQREGASAHALNTGLRCLFPESGAVHKLVNPCTPLLSQKPLVRHFPEHAHATAQIGNCEVSGFTVCWPVRPNLVQRRPKLVRYCAGIDSGGREPVWSGSAKSARDPRNPPQYAGQNQNGEPRSGPNRRPPLLRRKTTQRTSCLLGAHVSMDLLHNVA